MWLWAVQLFWLLCSCSALQDKVKGKVVTHLGIDYDWCEILVVNGETRTPEFLALNPAAQIPVVVLDNNEVLTQSNAILNFFSDESALMPTDSLDRFRVQEWQFYEQYNHEPTIAVRRFINKFLGMPSERQAEYDSKEEPGYRALGVMETEGGFDLSRFPGICNWLERVRQQPGYFSM